MQKPGRSSSLTGVLPNGAAAAAVSFFRDTRNTALLKTNANGFLIFANSCASELLTALGWHSRNALPGAFLRPARRALATARSVSAEIGVGELAYSFTIVASAATNQVRFFGVPVGGAPPGLPAILEALPNLIWAAHPSGKITYTNQRFREFIGVTGREVQQLRWESLCHPEDLPTYEGLWTKAARDRLPFELQLRYRRHDGQFVWFIGRFRPIKNPHGRITQWVGTATDIHAQKTAELELQTTQGALRSVAERLEQTVAERTAQLRRSLEETQAFAYSAAHDLNAPLRAIEAYVTAVLEDCRPALGSHAADLRLAIEAVQRMRSFSTALLEFGKLGQGDLPLRAVDFTALVREVIDDCPQFQPPLAQIDAPAAPLLVAADPASLIQCVANLLGNAVKFVAPDTVPRVRIRAEPNGSHIRILFEDNGIGIRKKDLPTIFNPFRRAATAEYEGHGLGLAIVQRAAGRMGGRVGVESEYGRGSCFWIDLPKPDRPTR